MRRAEWRDLPAIHAIMTDAQVMRFWSTLPHRSVEETERWLDSMINADPAISDDFVLEYEGQVIGKLGTWRLPEIGFYLARDQWGQGLAAEALEAFLAYIPSRGISALTADVDPGNEGSLRLLTRAGFEETGREAGTYRIGDRLCDSVYLRRLL